MNLLKHPHADRNKEVIEIDEEDYRELESEINKLNKNVSSLGTAMFWMIVFYMVFSPLIFGV